VEDNTNILNIICPCRLD